MHVTHSTLKDSYKLVTMKVKITSLHLEHYRDDLTKRCYLQILLGLGRMFKRAMLELFWLWLNLQRNLNFLSWNLCPNAS